MKYCFNQSNVRSTSTCIKDNFVSFILVYRTLQDNFFSCYLKKFNMLLSTVFQIFSLAQNYAKLYSKGLIAYYKCCFLHLITGPLPLYRP